MIFWFMAAIVAFILHIKVNAGFIFLAIFCLVAGSLQKEQAEFDRQREREEPWEKDQ